MRGFIIIFYVALMTEFADLAIGIRVCFITMYVVMASAVAICGSDDHDDYKPETDVDLLDLFDGLLNLTI